MFVTSGNLCHLAEVCSRSPVSQTKLMVAEPQPRPLNTALPRYGTGDVIQCGSRPHGRRPQTLFTGPSLIFAVCSSCLYFLLLPSFLASISRHRVMPWCVRLRPSMSFSVQWSSGEVSSGIKRAKAGTVMRHGNIWPSLSTKYKATDGTVKILSIHWMMSLIVTIWTQFSEALFTSQQTADALKA